MNLMRDAGRRECGLTGHICGGQRAFPMDVVKDLEPSRVGQSIGNAEETLKIKALHFTPSTFK
jgi:hypothetical protein